MFSAMEPSKTGDNPGKKDEFIRIRADEHLKRMLSEAASKAHRKEADHARYLIERGLGLIEDPDVADLKQRVRELEKRLDRPNGPVKKSARR